MESRLLKNQKLNQWIKVTCFFLIACFYIVMMMITFATSSALPKLASAMVIPFAIVVFFKRADFENVFYQKNVFFVLIGLYFVQFTVTLFIWIYEMTTWPYMQSGIQKIVFCFVCVCAAYAAVYLFQDRTVTLTLYAAVLINSKIILEAFIANGVSESINSIILFITTFGEQEGFMRDIEIHELTYAYGLFMIYYIFQCKKSMKYRVVHTFISAFFFISGFKRIGLAATAAAILLGFFLKRRKPKTRTKMIVVITVGLILFLFVYVPITKYDLFVKFMQQLNIPLNGRSQLLEAVDGIYDFSPTFTGHGFNYLVPYLNLNRTYSNGESLLIHNDIVKTYIEQGFWGFIIFIVYRVGFMQWFFTKHVSDRAGLLHLLLTVYSFVTYMVGNTCYAYVVLIVLWVILLQSEFDNKEKHNKKTGEALEKRIQKIVSKIEPEEDG